MDWPGWDPVLKVLRDPLTALIVSIVLALLAVRAVQRLVRWLLILAAIATFIWLLTRYESFADVTVAVVGSVGKILIALVCLAAVVAVVAIVAVLVMYIKSEERPHLRSLDSDGPSLRPAEHLTARPDPGEAPIAWLDHAAERMADLFGRLTAVVEPIFDRVDNLDSMPELVGALLRGYFTGLRPYRSEIRRIHAICNEELRQLATTLPTMFDGVGQERLTRMAKAHVLLPDREAWQALSDDGEMPMPYFVMRILCLHRRWREFATVMYKTYFASALLAECSEAV